MPALHRAPDTLYGSEEVPGLADLNEISWRPNRLTTGAPVVLPPNFGQESSMMPIDGWRFAPQLNAAAGVAPRDTGIPVYINTPPPPQSKYNRVAPVLMWDTAQDRQQSSPAAPVEFVPGGTAGIAGVGK